MSDAVFLDTNSLRNADPMRFFGNVARLEQISRLATIYVPDVVIEEIKCQKRERLKGQFSKFTDNYFFSHVECDQADLERHIEERIDELYGAATEELPFQIKKLEDDSEHIRHLLGLAMQNRAPFETGTDKGFKDACIYLTILQHLDATSDTVFLFTDDGRLRDSFDSYERVRTLKEPEQYFDYRSSFFREQYFLEQLTEDFENLDHTPDGIEFTEEVIKAATVTDDDDWLLEVEVNEEGWHVVVDFYSKEVLEVRKR